MDKMPENVNVGVINPYAMTEAIIGKKIDWSRPDSIKIMEDALETNYSELFDIQYHSPLYTGMELTKKGEIKMIKPSSIKIRSASDKESMDFSTLRVLKDLDKAGVKDLSNIVVKRGQLDKGRLKVILDIPKLNHTVTNRITTEFIKKLVVAGAESPNQEFTPENMEWKDMGDFFKDVVEYDDPIQGAVGNCYFIAAISAIAWADPYRIVHRVRSTGTGEADRVNAIQFYSKGGSKDAPNKLIEVTDKTIVNSNNRSVYCRSNDAGEIWPALYEKAFAKWITRNNTDKPDISATSGGDPAKAVAQLNNKKAYYYSVENRSDSECYTIVRQNSMSRRTINPMVAWTYPSGEDRGISYSGANIAANHAYTILGWTFVNNKKYIVLRNPWGRTEPNGVNTYNGIVSFFDNSFWRPIKMINNDGVFALEAQAFKHYFAWLGVAK